MIRKLSVLLAGALLCALAFGQSVPNGGTITNGQVWTVPQWVNAWQSKFDVTGGSLTAPTINNPTITGGALTSPTITTPAVTGGTFSSPAITGAATLGGTAFATSATVDTTNASNISSGTLSGSRVAAVNLAASGNGGVTGILPLSNFNLAGTPTWTGLNTFSAGLSATTGAFSSALTFAGVQVPTYPRTPAEIGASVTPVNFQYPAGNVLRYGANTVPGTTDMTAAVTAAIAQGVLSDGAEVFFPVVSTNPAIAGTFQNDYLVTSVIPIVGALRMRGQIDEVTFKGPRINSNVNGDTFTVTGSSSISLTFEDLGFTNSSAGSTAGAAFLHMTTTGGAASIHFKNAWFYLPNFYALNFNGPIDDIQILGCTFDVSAHHWIAVGGSSGQVTNISLVGNTFFGLENQGMIDLINVRNAVITGNRFYNAAGQPPVPYIINGLTDFPIAIENLVVSGNTFDIANDAVIIGSAVSAASITGNTFNAFSAGPAIAGGGGVAINQIAITGNIFNGNSGSGGVIDFTGTPLTNSVIANNSILGSVGGTSAVGVNVPSASNANNVIGPNAISGSTAQYGISAWAGQLGTVGPQTFVGTLTGVTGSPTATFRYSISGNSVTLTMVGNLTGAAAGTAPQITGLPAAITPANMQTFPIAIQNNSAFGPGFLQISGTTLSLFSSSFGAFTNSGTNGAVSFSITYQLS